MTDLIMPLPLFDPEAAEIPEAVLERMQAFGDKWGAIDGSEQQLSQTFLVELCDAIGTARPSDLNHTTDEYCFEKWVHTSDGRPAGRIDMYKKGHFLLEAKCGRRRADSPGSAPVRGTRQYDAYIEGAYQDQASVYAALLPEGRPPALMVADIGHGFWVWRRTPDGRYPGFHDPDRVFVPIARLGDVDHARWLVAAFTNPEAMDGSRYQARVTEAVSAALAPVAASLAARYPSEVVGPFLIRCLFCMFAEDVTLLPEAHFRTVLKRGMFKPEAFPRELSKLFVAMRDGGDYAWEVVRRFNGALFSNTDALELKVSELGLLADAAARNWSHVEPSIFGTLIERALADEKRKRLGAHYTPRSFVERLVQPVLGDPLRQEWALRVRGPAEVLIQEADEARTAAGALVNADVADIDARRARDTEFRKLLDKAKAAENEAHDLVDAFLARLARIKVLDPACGTGNFLYVSYATLKTLEFEVHAWWRATRLGGVQEGLALGGSAVSPQQMLGIELEPFAAEIAQLVLWIGHLQWEIRYRGATAIPDPVISSQRTIENRDAVMTWERTEVRRNADGSPVTRWIWGRYIEATTHQGQVPDPTARTEVLDYFGVKQASWPEAEFIVGNPPFIGNKMMRDRLGDGYVEALRKAYKGVPDTVDFVMYWWHRAAEATRAGKTKRFGLITTNSIRQSFNRPVIAAALSGENSLRLVFAVPDHPWTDDGAAVRISMTAAEREGDSPSNAATLVEVQDETRGHEDVLVGTRSVARIHPDLKVGVNATTALPLKANSGVGFQGMNLVGKGFRVTPAEVTALGFDPTHPPRVIRPYLNALEFMRAREGRFVIDAYGLTDAELRVEFPTCYQWLLDRVKPERDLNNRDAYKKRWWQFGEARSSARPFLLGLPRFIITPRTSKHRVYGWVPAATDPDCKLIAIALADDHSFGVLQSRWHNTWALRAAGSQGVGNDPVYDNGKCFATFPFPDASATQRERVGAVARDLHAFREAAKARNPDLTFTTMYNLVAARRVNETLTPKLAKLHTVLGTDALIALHDALDAAVADAYGWPANLTDEQLLERLLALNHARAAEEAAGKVRWLRPDLAGVAVDEPEADMPDEDDEVPAAVVAKVAEKTSWPTDRGEQMVRVFAAVESAGGLVEVERIAATFKNARRESVARCVGQLAAMRMIVREPDGRVRSVG